MSLVIMRHDRVSLLDYHFGRLVGMAGRTLKLLYLSSVKPSLNLAILTPARPFVLLGMGFAAFLVGRWFQTSVVIHRFQENIPLDLGGNWGHTFFVIGTLGVVLHLLGGTIGSFHILPEWKTMCEIMPQKARSAISYSILVDALCLDVSLGQGLVLFGILFGLGLGAIRSWEILVLVALYSIGCRSFRAVVQVMRICWRRGDVVGLCTSLMLVGLSIAYGSLPSWLQAVLPQRAVMLIGHSDSRQMLSAVSVAMAAYLAIILGAILFVLSRADIPTVLRSPDQTVGSLMQLMRRVAPKCVKRLTGVSTKNRAFGNLILHGLKCCLYDVHGVQYLLLEALILVGLLVYLKSRQDAIPIVQVLVCCLLFGLPGYCLAGSLLKGLKGVFWLVKISRYSSEMSVLAYGCAGYVCCCLACLVMAVALKICGAFEFAAVFFVPWACFAFLPGVVLFTLRSHVELFLSHALSTLVPLMVEAMCSRVVYLTFVVIPSTLGVCLLIVCGSDSCHFVNILLGAFWYNVFLGYYMVRKTVRALALEVGMTA